jgi:GLPGLI family protein
MTSLVLNPNLIPTMIIRMTLIALLSGVSLAKAQQKEGRVVYERKTNMHKRLPPEAEQMKAMIPEFQVNKSELLFTANQSLFKALPEEQDQMPATGNESGPRFVMRMGSGGPNDETFRNYETEQIVESRELGPKKYLIEDTLRTLKWKLEQDTMTINGKLCYKATTTVQSNMGGGRRMMMSSNGSEVKRDTVRSQTPPTPQQNPVVAWYCPEVETQAGPENFFGLPGLIMKVDVDNGFMVMTALSIEPMNKQVVKAPTSGKKITREEYRKMMEQQFQGMRPPGGGQGGNRMMIIQQ